MKKYILLFLCSFNFIFGQNYSKKDTLLGSNTMYRDFWDVRHYAVEIEPDFEQKSLKGKNKITFEIVKDAENPVFQIDLQTPMKYDKIDANFRIKSKRVEGNFIFIETQQRFRKGERYELDIAFSGNPTIAQNAPWDGGWFFTKDNWENPWMSVACEDIGASVWLPIKEYWGDEPDEGARLTIITPKNLVGIGNGRLIEQKSKGDKNSFTWEVKNPINSYNIIPYIGKYTHFSDEFLGEKGKLSLDYWVLEGNKGKAQKQFLQVKPMLNSFEYWFGAYPFYEDGYKIVESPYLGMEHQSNIAYGNGYQNGYLGEDLSGTGVGLYWDFIIVHESGHEWFGNNITAKDKADMWIHEAFTSYSETLFVESIFGKKAAETYVIGTRQNILNDKPIVGHYGVRDTGSGDQYMKGANMLHTIRQVIGNDDLFRQILRGLNTEFYHKTITGKQVEDYISQKSEIDFSSIFDQYLRTIKIPKLQYQQQGKNLKYRWVNAVENLKLPIKIKSHQLIIQPKEDWQTLVLPDSNPVQLDENYYIDIETK